MYRSRSTPAAQVINFCCNNQSREYLPQLRCDYFWKRSLSRLRPRKLGFCGDSYTAQFLLAQIDLGLQRVPLLRSGPFAPQGPQLRCGKWGGHLPIKLQWDTEAKLKCSLQTETHSSR